MTNSFSSVSIIGLGLIGGSMARMIKRCFDSTRIFAMDADSTNLSNAQLDGIIDFSLPMTTSGFQTAAKSNLVLIATPIDSAMSALKSIAPHVTKGTIVSDMCSTKTAIINLANDLQEKYEDLCFIGGHPMAGSEKSGYHASSSHLFENAAYLLCSSKDDGLHSNAISKLGLYIQTLGACPMIVNPDEHDKSIAVISHLPHIVASSLVNVASDNEDREHTLSTLAAGGFKDITRIASGNPKLWRTITMDNKTFILNILEEYKQSLDAFCKAIESEDSTSLEMLFSRAKSFRDSLSSAITPPSVSVYNLSVDVEDRQGIIAEVAGILDQAKINIRNLYIASNREISGGCLQLSFSTIDLRDRALKVLSFAGYNVSSQ